jgi:hypothetical protein
MRHLTSLLKKGIRVIDKEKLFLLIGLCVIVSALFLRSPLIEEKRQHLIARENSAHALTQDLQEKEELLKKQLVENEAAKKAANIAGFFMILVVFLGIGLDVEYFKRRLQGTHIPIPAVIRPRAQWGLIDVGKVVLLYLFFANILRIIQWCALDTENIVRHGSLLLVGNTAFLDIVAILAIAYCVRGVHKQKLAQVGLSKKLLFHNVFFGVSTYIAAIPFVIASLLLSMFIARVVHYTPSPQPLFVILFRETNGFVVMLFALLIVVIGPFAEELFFRGFLYGFFKRKLSSRDAIFLSAMLFSLVHSDPIGTLPIFCLGVFLAWIYEQTGSLAASFIFHSVHNLIMFSVMIFVKLLS